MRRLSEQIARLEERVLKKTKRWRDRHPGSGKLYAALGVVIWYFYGMLVNSVRLGVCQSFDADSGITDIWTVNPFLNLIALLVCKTGRYCVKVAKDTLTGG